MGLLAKNKNMPYGPTCKENYMPYGPTYKITYILLSHDLMCVTKLYN